MSFGGRNVALTGAARRRGRPRLIAGLTLVCLGSPTLAALSASLEASRWDAALPELPLGKVQIQVRSLQDAWIQISDILLLRSVLVVSRSVEQNGEFAFTVPNGVGSQVLDTLGGVALLTSV